MRHVRAALPLAVLALAALPLAAEAGQITVKNCSASSITVNAFKGQDTQSSSEGSTLPGGTASVYCPWTHCRLEITYNNPGPQVVNFIQPYEGNRCTNGVEDGMIPALPAAGSCRCG